MPESVEPDVVLDPAFLRARHEMIAEHLETSVAREPWVQTVEYDASIPRWYVRFGCDGRDAATIYFDLHQRTLRYELYFMPDPPAHREELYRYLLQHNHATYAAHFSIGPDGSFKAAAVPSLISRIENDAEPLIRSHALWGLGQLDPRRAIPAAEQTLRTDADIVRKFQAESDRLIAPGLHLAIAFHDDIGIRIEAVQHGPATRENSPVAIERFTDADGDQDLFLRVVRDAEFLCHVTADCFAQLEQAEV